MHQPQALTRFLHTLDRWVWRSLLHLLEFISEKEVPMEATLEDRARIVIEARDYHADNGVYPTFPNGPKGDQGFDDWAADTLAGVLGGDVPHSTPETNTARSLARRTQQQLVRLRPGGPDIVHAPLTSRNFQFHEPDELFGLGSLYFNGVLHHLCCLQVARDESGELKGVKDPHDRLDQVNGLYDDMDPMTIPGLEGEWFVWCHPGG